MLNHGKIFDVTSARAHYLARQNSAFPVPICGNDPGILG
jgi:hypothetical protein